MAGEFRTVVHGTREVTKAFEDVKTKVDPAIGKALRNIAKPVQMEAQNRAVSNFSNIGSGGRSWSRMRIGRKRIAIYVAEKQHSSGGSPRPSFVSGLYDTAMKPALEAHKAAVALEIERAIEKITKEEGF